jgi:hypothetical protein
MASQESEAASILGKEHSAQVAVAEADLAVVSNGARYAESLEAFADSLGSVSSSLAALLDSDSSAEGVSPLSVLESDRLEALYDLVGINALLVADLLGFVQILDLIFLANLIDGVNAALIAFKCCHCIHSS